MPNPTFAASSLFCPDPARQRRRFRRRLSFKPCTAVFRYHPFLLLVTLALTGCLPSSCQRGEQRALLPADSLSRSLAQTIDLDTLTAAWRTPPGTDALAFPRTALFDAAGNVVVADAERAVLLVFGRDGALLREIAHDGFATPYLAGRRGDTLAVFNPTTRRIDFVLDGEVMRTLPTPDEVPRSGTLQYAAVSNRAVFFKTLGDDFEGYVARLDEAGRIEERTPLPGTVWRHAGLLRTWGDTLLSLSGFRPVVDRLHPDGRLDTLALTGFDSPMLARSRQFLLDETNEAPLLIESAAPAGELLFVLNLRPGWLQIDAYDRTGHLQHRLIQPDPEYNKQFYPRDLAARRLPDGSYELAVVYTSPEPGVALYRFGV